MPRSFHVAKTSTIERLLKPKVSTLQRDPIRISRCCEFGHTLNCSLDDSALLIIASH